MNNLSWVPFADRDPVSIEKSNLVNIMKLVIREVLESSISFGRQLDSDFIPLQHFFVVLEHVLRHGFKPKKVMIISLILYFCSHYLLCDHVSLNLLDQT